MSIKRFFATLLSLVLLLSLVACQTGDKPNVGSESSDAVTTDEVIQESPAEDFEYTENEDGSITITKYVGNDTTVSVPSQINGKPVTKINNMCFSYQSTLVSIVLPEGLVEIGGGTFFFCANLETVALPTTLKIIGNGAFEHTAISNITFPEGLISIGTRAFFECMNLKHVVIHKNTSYGEETFSFSGVETVVIEEGVETLADSMFAYTNIREVVFPESLKHIPSAAFCECEKLESVTLNNGLVTIGAYAFADTKITEIVIPKTVTQIVDNVFKSCFLLQKVKFEGDAPSNDYISGVKDMPQYTIFYHADAKGFFSPEWNGYPTQIW